MNKGQVIVFLAALVILSIGLTAIFYSHYYVRDVMYLNTSFEVGKKVGLQVDTGSLAFGRAPPGGASTRYITITNPYENPIKVEISFEGDITRLISTSNQTFVLQGYQNESVGFSVAPLFEEPHGNFTGHVRIVFKRDSIFG